MRTYKCLNENIFTEGDFSLVPIRDEDQLDIMKWRNEQMDVLRQSEMLTKEKQELYFNSVVADLFEQKNPKQILFSFLKGNLLVGYGGLVHISWIDKRAEISFLLDSEISKSINTHCVFFENYLTLIQKIGFNDLAFHKLFAEVYDTRKYHTNVLENCGFLLEGRLKEHIKINQIYVDSLCYGKLNK